VDNEVHYTARDRRTPRVIPSVQLHERSVGKGDTTAARGTLCVDAVPTQWTSIPTMRSASTVESPDKTYI
jgi:hypothetical protein